MNVRPGYVKTRIRICKHCEHIIEQPPDGYIPCCSAKMPVDKFRCGILVEQGKDGFIMHEKGIPNASAECPLPIPKWRSKQ